MAEVRRRRGGRKPISQDWVDRVKQLAVNEPDLSGRQIEARLKVEAEREGRTDYPGERRIRQIKAAITDAERVGYFYVRWPESFGPLLLPWEAAAALLEWMAWLHQRGQGRPVLRVARWYWQITLAAPDAPIGTRDRMAVMLAAEDRLREAGMLDQAGGSWRRIAEWWLAYRPWRSPAALQTYRSVVARGAFGEAEAVQGSRGLPGGEWSDDLAPFAYTRGMLGMPELGEGDDQNTHPDPEEEEGREHNGNQ